MQHASGLLYETFLKRHASLVEVSAAVVACCPSTLGADLFGPGVCLTYEMSFPFVTKDFSVSFELLVEQE